MEEKSNVETNKFIAYKFESFVPLFDSNQQ
jgi:hypothetical protein